MPLNRAKFHFDTIYGDMNVTIGPYLLYQAGDLCCEPGYRVPPHRQLVYEITYVAEGTGTNSTNGRGQPMSRGDVFVNRIGELHEIQSSKDDPLRFYYLGFRFTGDAEKSAFVRRLRETLDNPANLCLHGVTDMQEAFIRLFSELITDDFLSPSLLEGTIHQIVGTAYRLFSQKRYRAYLADQARETDEKLVYDIIHYLDSHIADIGSLSGLSTVFGYSYTYLAHKFVSITGETLKTYAARRRFEKAREYLCRGMSITSVAEALGYQSIHAFSRAFHREIGLSPREYKRWAEDNRKPPGDSPILQKKELFP
ncbi:AraC family transcriptional regulator [Anaeromassilibacillus sp. SJQ-5]|jgi:araC-type DNA-binding domain-containing proteins